MCFIAVQVGYTVVGFMSRANWVHEALEKSWDKAYLSDKSLIHDLQIEVGNNKKKKLKAGRGDRWCKDTTLVAFAIDMDTNLGIILSPFQ